MLGAESGGSCAALRGQLGIVCLLGAGDALGFVHASRDSCIPEPGEHVLSSAIRCDDQSWGGVSLHPLSYLLIFLHPFLLPCLSPLTHCIINSQ